MDLGMSPGSYRRLNAVYECVGEGKWDIAHFNRDITNTTRELGNREMARDGSG